MDKTGHTSKTSSFNDRRESQDQPEAHQRVDAQANDFETVYNDGLILQEKASTAGGSTQGQLDLLKQVRAHSVTHLQAAVCSFQLAL